MSEGFVQILQPTLQNLANIFTEYLFMREPTLDEFTEFVFV